MAAAAAAPVAAAAHHDSTLPAVNPLRHHFASRNPSRRPRQLLSLQQNGPLPAVIQQGHHVAAAAAVANKTAPCQP